VVKKPRRRRKARRQERARRVAGNNVENKKALNDRIGVFLFSVCPPLDFFFDIVYNTRRYDIKQIISDSVNELSHIMAYHERSEV